MITHRTGQWAACWWLPVALIAAGSVVLSGCSSIHSAAWTRAGDEQLHRDPCAQCLNGVPVMLKVPSHLEVAVHETLYAAHDEAAGALRIVPLRRPDLSVDARLRYTEKMFLVDPVKVASGSGAYSFDFSGSKGPAIANANGESAPGHGYLHAMKYRAEDTTITEGSRLLASVLSFSGAAARGSAKRTGDIGQTDLVSVDRVIAYGCFDLGNPQVEAEVFAFLESHLNQCHQCGPGGLTSPGRLPDQRLQLDLPADGGQRR